MSASLSAELQGSDVVAGARVYAMQRAAAVGCDEHSHDAALVVTELVTNALLHGGGCGAIDVRGIDGGLRIEVEDRNRIPPLLGDPSEDSLTGRGLRLVAALISRWGAEPRAEGKVVWAEITGDGGEAAAHLGEDDLLALWDDDWHVGNGAERHHLELGDVPTDLLLAAKSHVDNVVREFTLAAAGARAGLTAQVPAPLAALLESVVDRFAEARLAIKHQALEAVHRGAPTTSLVLELPSEAADAAEDYLQALDEVDAYCRARRLLTLETPPQHRIFRQWYIGELVAQLRAAAAGLPAPEVVPFTQRLLAEVDQVAGSQQASERAARLYAVAAALVSATSADAVAAAVLNEGVAALGAAGGGLLLETDLDTLALPGAVGYDQAVVERLRHESRDAELPAAVALRTGEAVWLESRAERDRRFPELVGLEATTVSLCAVPLMVGGRRLGALRFSFTEARLFDEDERRFVLALAAQTAQALDRAQLQDSMVALLENERAAREALDRENRLVETLDRVGRAVTSRLELKDVMQQVTDAATDLTKAAFGAFFYNAVDEEGEAFQPHTLSGASHEAFDHFLHPRNTAIFSATLPGAAVQRFDDVTQDPRYGRKPSHFGMSEEHLPVRSYLAVPVTSSSGEVMGGLFFGHPERGRFGPEDERLVLGIVGYAAIALENARLFEHAQRQVQHREAMLEQRELVSRALEQPLVPPAIPTVPGLDIAAVYEPFGDALSVGGDFYDVFAVPGDRWAFVVGDVAGKGPAAAGLTGLARPTAWAAGRASGDPSKMLELLNGAILRAATELFCTAAAAVVDPTGAEIRARIAVGGHPGPIVLRADGTTVRMVTAGPLIGVLADAAFPATTVTLQHGDVIVFYTDGLTEGGGPQTFDDAELLEFLAGLAGSPASAIADALATEAAQRRPQLRDDLAILVVRVG